ncbi:MAG: competence/damage-inducible protein A [Bacteroidales bacterium]|jgi:nicotinamide-nucleotide amidase
MKAQIITIGDELLIGQTIDTNSAWIGAEMSKLGFDVCRKVSVHDLRNDILDSLREAEGKAEVVLVTGGLGPTSDDITKQTICEFFGTKLVTDNKVLAMITEMMNKRGFPMNENNRRQAEVPESCRVLENSAGTAPGMWFEKKRTIFIFMPGVPHEMKYLMSTHVLPDLSNLFNSHVIIYRNIMTYGVSEARLAEMLEGFESGLPPEIKLAYLPSSGIIKLRLTGNGREKAKLNSEMEEQVKNLYKVIPELIYGENEEPLEKAAGRLLTEKRQTICTAESCTGGKIAHMLTSIPGSSLYYMGTIVAYDNEVKENILGVPGNIIRKYGAVSEEVARAMAEGAREIMKTDFAIATTGIAGPDGGTEDKPVGTLCIAVASPHVTVSEKRAFGNERITNLERFSNAALYLAIRQIIIQ